MGWFTRQRLKLAWMFTTQGSLWRLVPSEGGVFVGEDRDVQNKSVSFFCVEQISGRVRWKDVQTDERWWISIHTVHGGIVVLHGYAEPDMPEPKGMYAFDLMTGNPFWSNKELTPLFAHDNRMYASKTEYDRQQLYEVNLQSGDVVREVPDDHVALMKSRSVIRDIAQFPELLNPKDATDVQRRGAIEKAMHGARNIVQVECLKHRDLFVVGFYDNPNLAAPVPQLQQRLVIVNQNNNKVLFRDIVDSQATAPIPESFFRIDDHVYYVKERKSLCAINLTF